MQRTAELTFQAESLDAARQRVANYLPSNYRVGNGADLRDGRFVVQVVGQDNAGWTLDEYVLPRLASGMIFGHETTKVYIAICDHYWGKGNTPAEAKANMKRVGGSLAQHIVYRLPEGTKDHFVDDFGNLRWSLEEGGDPAAQATEVSRRGI